MIIIASKEEKELLKRLREFKTTDIDSVPSLTADVVNLKKEVANLEISRDKKQEDFDRRERELRHQIGLEKKRQEFEIDAASRSAELTVREKNLQADQKRFEEQLKFNTERFQKMESTLTDLMSKILERLPNISMKVKG